MKIGILTFHSEINYGSVLQALAMQTHLESMGHQVVVIDKWEDPFNKRLMGPFTTYSLMQWCGLFFRGFLLTGDFARLRRRIKSLLFIRRYLKRTNFSFFKWIDAPNDLGVDMIVVGSDQVWNPIIVDPPDYLMKATPHIPAIAYAASIGRHELDPRWKSEYIAGFRRFLAIGVREEEAKRLVEATGAVAEHVVDPTLLVDPACWGRFASQCASEGKKLFCYIMTPAIVDCLPALFSFANAMRAEVDLFVDNQLLFSPTTIRKCWRWVLLHLALVMNRRVHVRLGADMGEFVKSVSAASWVITESFHGLMFATIFRKNVRVLLRDTHDSQSEMSARLSEFANGIINGRVVCESLSLALDSIKSGEVVSYNEDRLAKRVVRSREWLSSAIDCAKRKA